MYLSESANWTGWEWVWLNVLSNSFTGCDLGVCAYSRSRLLWRTLLKAGNRPIDIILIDSVASHKWQVRFVSQNNLGNRLVDINYCFCYIGTGLEAPFGHLCGVELEIQKKYVCVAGSRFCWHQVPILVRQRSSWEALLFYISWNMLLMAVKKWVEQWKELWREKRGNEKKNISNIWLRCMRSFR